MVTVLKLGDVVSLVKTHPCGSFEWEIVRIGADIRIRCVRCDRLVLMPRSSLEKRMRAVRPVSISNPETGIDMTKSEVWKK